nr:TolC family protein [Saccharobesus litoralis]
MEEAIAKSAQAVTDAGYYPTVSVQAKIGRQYQNVIRSETTVYPIEENDYRANNTSLNVNQVIYDGALFAESKVAELDVTSAQLQLKAEQQALAYEIAEAYVELLKSYDNLAYVGALQLASEAELKKAAKQRERGINNRVEFTEVKARYAETQAQVADAEQQKRDAEDTIVMLTGVVANGIQPISGQFNYASVLQADLTTYIQSALQSNPAIRKAIVDRQSAEQSIDTESGRYEPNVTFQIQANRDDSGGSLFGGATKIDTVSASVLLNVPIYSGGAGSASIMRASQELQRSSFELEQKKREVMRDVRRAYSRIQTQQSRIESMSLSVEAYATALQAKQTGSRSGVFTQVDVLNAKKDLSFAQKDLAEAKYDLILSFFELKKALGELSAEDLIRINT